FGKDSSVNVGTLVASTLDIKDEDFRKGRYRFAASGSSGSIVNEGSLKAASGGAIALLAKQVDNRGVIVARLGTVALASGNRLTLDFKGDGLLKVSVDEAAVNALVENHNLVVAAGGQVLMTAHARDALMSNVVNNTGIVRATGLVRRNGEIVLEG